MTNRELKSYLNERLKIIKAMGARAIMINNPVTEAQLSIFIEALAKEIANEKNS